MIFDNERICDKHNEMIQWMVEWYLYRVSYLTDKFIDIR